jgi:hypothetical protein
MYLFTKSLCFIIPETAINLIVWKQFISSVLRRKDVVCVANICSHVTLVLKEQCNDLIFN